MFVLEVVKIARYCPIYKVGDKLIFHGPRIVLDDPNKLCESILQGSKAIISDPDRHNDENFVFSVKCKHYDQKCNVHFRLYNKNKK